MALIFWASMLLLMRQFGAGGVISTGPLCLIAALDSLLFALPVVMVRPSLRRWSGLWLAFWALLIWGNSIYVIHFGEPVPALSYFHHDGAGRFIVAATLASMGIADWGLLAAVVAVVAFAFVSGRKMAAEPGFRLRVRVGYLGALLVCFAAVSALAIRRLCIWDNLSGLAEANRDHWHSWVTDVHWARHLQSGGFGNYVVAAAAQLMAPRVTLSDADRAEIKEYFKQRPMAEPDSAFRTNRHKNLVLIVVESLNSRALRLPWSAHVAPTLSALMEDSTVSCALNVVSQVGPGRSADGQFIYNTGLLPLRLEPFAIRFAQQAYPSLVKALCPAEAIEVIGESADLHRHNITSLSYGYDRIHEKLAEEWSYPADSVILSAAARLIGGLRQPFVAEITTLTMHQPYLRPDPEATVELPDPLTPALTAYLHALSRFDRALAAFFSEMKRAGLFDDTIFVIASDHDEAVDGLDSDRIAFFIVNSGRGVKVAETREQIDLYPTILHAMGVDSYVPPRLGVDYSGLGTSIFLPAKPTGEAERTLSEMIITGLFF